MLNNISFSLTNKCNSRCRICNIWKTKSFEDEMSVPDIKHLFEHKCFSQVDTISLTGGEPFLRKDIIDVVYGLKESMPNLQRLFLNTNATNIPKIVQVCKISSNLFNSVILSVSLDGEKEIHDRLRGIKNYDNVISLLKVMQQLPEINLSVSMTLSQENTNLKNLKHVKNIAENNNAMFNFRFADKSSTYYKNMDLDLSVTENQKKQVSDFIIANCSDNAFLMCLKQFIDTGNLDLLIQNGKNKCLAGKKFVFIHPNGVISPCLYSTQHIAPDDLLSKAPIVIGTDTPCPCCTDCVIYPMLEELQKSR
ncbi:MAG: radical SAM protein [Alphaproteobacteria bacterium]|nr:radical SAM protein [Alphaproteobacteria bacterium]